MTRVDTAAARWMAEEVVRRAHAIDRPMTIMMLCWADGILDLADALDAARAALPSAVWLEWIADSFVGVTHPNAADMRAAIHAAAANIRALDAPPATVAGAGE